MARFQLISDGPFYTQLLEVDGTPVRDGAAGENFVFVSETDQDRISITPDGMRAMESQPGSDKDATDAEHSQESEHSDVENGLIGSVVKEEKLSGDEAVVGRYNTRRRKRKRYVDYLALSTGVSEDDDSGKVRNTKQRCNKKKKKSRRRTGVKISDKPKKTDKIDADLTAKEENEEISEPNPDKSADPPAMSLPCPMCGEAYSKLDELREHVIEVHPDVDVTTVCEIMSSEKPKSTRGKKLTEPLSCSICEKLFYTQWSLKQHVIKIHPEVDVKAVLQIRPRGRPKAGGTKPRPRVMCSLCGRSLRQRSDLKRHFRFVHGVDGEGNPLQDPGPEVVKRKKLGNTRMKCPVCHAVLRKMFGHIHPTMSDLIQHLNQAHDQGIKSELKSFESEVAFKEWLAQIERDTPCTFVRMSRKVRQSKKCVMVYKCSRSNDTYQRSRCTPGLLKKRFKGATKVEYTCPAHVKCEVNGSQYDISYVQNHYCHSSRYEQLRHMRMPDEDRKWFAEKLAQNIPVEAILSEARSYLDGERLQRRHLVTKDDLRNIAKAFGLPQPESMRVNNATTVDALVQAYGAADSSPVILYKRQGTTSIDLCPEEFNVSVWLDSDFLFGFMDQSQCEMLKRFGMGDLSTVCIDSKHGTNSFDFYITTIMVLDSNGEGFPVAFLYSTRETITVLELFFACVKSRSGIVSPNSFMCDMSPQSEKYNAWQRVMGSSKHILYCPWHVDKALRDIARCRIKDNTELSQQVYKQIRVLVDEPDAAQFETAINNLVSVLWNDPATTEFAQYFQANYIVYAGSWAFCYLSQYCSITSIESLERMREMFNHIFQCIQRKKDLDSAIRTITRLIYDKEFDRIKSLSKEKPTGKLSKVDLRHRRSLSLDVMCAEIIQDQEWIVQSNSVGGEVYTVRRAKEICACGRECKECQACVHNYSCTCEDRTKRFNMCAHIHLVCTKTILGLAGDIQVEYVEVCHETPVVDVPMSSAVLMQSQPTVHVARQPNLARTLERHRETARNLTIDVANFIETVQDANQMLAIIETLKAVVQQ